METVEACSTALVFRWKLCLTSKMGMSEEQAGSYATEWLQDLRSEANGDVVRELRLLQAAIILPYSPRQEELLQGMGIGKRLKRHSYTPATSPKTVSYNKFATVPLAAFAKACGDGLSATGVRIEALRAHLDQDAPLGHDAHLPSELAVYLQRSDGKVCLSHSGVTATFVSRYNSEQTRIERTGGTTLWEKAAAHCPDQAPHYYLREDYAELAARKGINLEEARIEAEIKHWVLLEGPFCTNIMPPGSGKPIYKPERVLSDAEHAILESHKATLQNYDDPQPSSILLIGAQSPGVRSNNLLKAQVHRYVQDVSHLLFGQGEIHIGTVPPTRNQDWHSGPNVFHRDVHSVLKVVGAPYTFSVEQARNDLRAFLEPLARPGKVTGHAPVWLVSGNSWWFDILLDMDPTKAESRRAHFRGLAEKGPLLFEIDGYQIVHVGEWSLLSKAARVVDPAILQHGTLNLLSTALDLIIAFSGHRQTDRLTQVQLDEWCRTVRAGVLLKARSEVRFTRFSSVLRTRKPLADICELFTSTALDQAISHSSSGQDVGSRQYHQGSKARRGD